MHLTVHRIDVGELNFDHTDTVSITFPNPDDLMNFKVAIMPDEGFYAGGRFQFSITIPSVYPHEPPKCHCDTKVGAAVSPERSFLVYFVLSRSYHFSRAPPRYTTLTLIYKVMCA